ncbi:hypothetical protein ACQ33O_11945 [Ferruginibacter sp. SUN002]|uniref:hypothetical protein n=1 Tax=Ferruginibacter sp. SUN002 TaxID=2937789 RepID=UPI003D35A136
MKIYFISIFLFLGFNVNSQNTLVEPHLNASKEDSLINIFEEKDRIKKEEIRHFCQENLFKIDSVYSNKDSSLIHFLTFDGKIIKEEKKIYLPSTDFLSDSIISFFNLNNQLIYFEHWELVVNTPNIDGTGFTRLEIILPQYPSFRIRNEYDKLNRETLSVFSRNSFTFRVRTIYTSANNSEDHESHTEDIKWYQFWEN